MAGTIDIDRTIIAVAGRRAGVCTRTELLAQGVRSAAIGRRPTPAHDLVVIHGLPVTGPALTIIDLAAVVGSARLRHLVQTQISAGKPTLVELVASLDSVARRRVNGIGSLRSVLAPMVDGSPVPASALERAVANLSAEHGIVGFLGTPERRPGPELPLGDRSRFSTGT